MSSKISHGSRPGLVGGRKITSRSSRRPLLSRVPGSRLWKVPASCPIDFSRFFGWTPITDARRKTRIAAAASGCSLPCSGWVRRRGAADCKAGRMIRRWGPTRSAVAGSGRHAGAATAAHAPRWAYALGAEAVALVVALRGARFMTRHSANWRRAASSPIPRQLRAKRRPLVSMTRSAVPASARQRTPRRACRDKCLANTVRSASSAGWG